MSEEGFVGRVFSGYNFFSCINYPENENGIPVFSNIPLLTRYSGSGFIALTANFAYASDGLTKTRIKFSEEDFDQGFLCDEKVAKALARRLKRTNGNLVE